MAHQPRRRRAAQRCAMLAALSTAAHSPAANADQEWNFVVRLDDRVIGTHRFQLASAGTAEQSLTSNARFDVKILGLTVYHYQHQAQERWRDGCLVSVSARTDDHGELTVVTGQDIDNRFNVMATTGGKTARTQTQGCMVNFAYWSPEQLARQYHLLDQGTGRIEAVTITALPPNSIPVRGMPTPVAGLRISGLKHPIDVWYAGNLWVGLDTAADGGRKLTYRLN
jgi:hypothetical protein